MTLDTDTIRLVNCYIYVDNDNTIDASAPQGTETQAVTNSQDVVVYGGMKMIENFVTATELGFIIFLGIRLDRYCHLPRIVTREMQIRRIMMNLVREP